MRERKRTSVEISENIKGSLVYLQVWTLRSCGNEVDVDTKTGVETKKMWRLNQLGD